MSEKSCENCGFVCNSSDCEIPDDCIDTNYSNWMPIAGEKPDITLMQDLISDECDQIKLFLIKKNAAYGNSAETPIRIFSKGDAIEQVNVRIDDKLNRMARGGEYQGDDTELDLIGYLILKRAIKKTLSNKK